MKKHGFRLGPATTLAVAGAIVVAYMRFPAWQRQNEDARRLEIIRAELRNGGKRKVPPGRSLQSLWDERIALRLSPSQLRALQSLRTEETQQSAPLKRSAELARRDFEDWMKAHQQGVAISDIQQRSRAYSAASAPLTQEHEHFWKRALSLLSPAQRAQTQSQP
jgi:hypothetical protein